MNDGIIIVGLLVSSIGVIALIINHYQEKHTKNSH